jgi:hypothetical protein
MQVQDFFDFSGIDILTAADEHILFAVNDIEITFFIKRSEITGMKEATFVDSGNCRGLIIEIAGAIRRTFEDKLAWFIRTEEVVPVIDDPRVHEEVGPTDRSRLANGVLRCKRKNAGTKLGHAESLLEADILFLRVFLHQWNR